MPALHVLATLLLAPYVALAILLLAFGHATSRGSLWGFLDAVLNHALWIIPWGVIGFVVAVLAIAGLGIARRTRVFASALLCALAVVSPIVLVAVTGSRLDAERIIFLAPCIAVAIFGGWRVRAERRVRHGGQP